MRKQTFTKSQIIILSAMAAVLLIAALIFVFLPKDKISPQPAQPAAQASAVKPKVKHPKSSKGVKLDMSEELSDPGTIPDPNEADEAADYANFENTIDKLIDMTDS